MAQPTYTNETLAALLKEMKQENNKAHGEIIEHQKFTNGRIRKLEAWKMMVVGGLIFVNVIAIPILLMVISKYISSL